MNPKDFCKANVLHNRRRYDNSTQFYKDYFSSDVETLTKVIKKYKQSHGAHKKGEEYLAYLLK